MVTVSWSPQLINVVKEFKGLEVRKIVSTFNGSKYMESHGITSGEAKALSSPHIKKQIQCYWY